MSRRIVVQVSAPALLVGLLLLATGLAAAWSLTRLQQNLANILTENVASLEAAGELEISLRQMRFYTFLFVLEPTPERWNQVEATEREFKAAMLLAEGAVTLPAERELLEQIRTGYERYRAELLKGVPLPASATRGEALAWAEAHPVRHLVEPCQELLRVNKAAMEATARESEWMASQVRLATILVALLGSAGGVIGGFGIARGLSRSIARLRVRVADATAHLEEDAGEVHLAAPEGDLDALEGQMGRVVERVRGVVGEMHRQQAEAVRAEQLAAVGRLAAGVAHEIRNPLTAVKLLVGDALRDPDNRGLTSEDLRVIHGEVARLEGAVQNLLDFSRPTAPRREPTELREALARALDLVRPRAEQQAVAVNLTVPEEPVIAAVDPGQLRTVLINLLLNALDAMPTGGTLDLRLGVEAGRVRLTVADTGPGIDPTLRDRLFTPFASTKTAGTGLGLSLCRRVLRDHGGDVAATNRPDGGAMFIVTLPPTLRPEMMPVE